MYLKHLIRFLLFVILCTGCSKYSDKPPKDFSFEIIDDVDSYNSDSGYFIRKAINDKYEDTIVIYKLSQKDKEEIYKVIKENDIFSIPKGFECVSDAQFIVPAYTTILKYKIGNINNKIELNTSCLPKKNHVAEVRFKNITTFIRQKLSSKQVIKSIPKTKMRLCKT